MITADHIRYAQTGQLAKLLETDPSLISRWVYRSGFNSRSLRKGVDAGIPLEILVAGLEARREDALNASRLQREMDEFLSGKDGADVA